MAREDNLRVNVFLWGVNIGQLMWDPAVSLSVFQPSRAYEEMGFPVSPISHHSLSSGGDLAAVYGRKGERYQGLPPFLSDSLPDDWGNMLFDLWLSKTDIPASDVTALYKLSFIGKRGIGAFEYVPELEVGPGEADFRVDVSRLYQESLKVLADREGVAVARGEDLTMKRLIQLGTTAGGKHAKGIVAISDTTGEIRSGQVPLPPDFRYYILKFKEDPSVPTTEIEMVYNRMATESGINMMPCRLFRVDGINHFLTERFDRQGGKKILSQTLSAISPQAVDYTNLFWLCESLRLPEGSREQLFTRMVFNYVAGVTDDHNKNFSFLMDRNGRWSLSPAYDVMFTANVWVDPSARIHALGVSGKRSGVTASDLRAFGEDFEVKDVDGIISRVCNAVSRFPVLCEEYGVEQEWATRIQESLDSVFPERRRFACPLEDAVPDAVPEKDKVLVRGIAEAQPLLGRILSEGKASLQKIDGCWKEVDSPVAGSVYRTFYVKDGRIRIHAEDGKDVLLEASVARHIKEKGKERKSPRPPRKSSKLRR